MHRIAVAGSGFIAGQHAAAYDAIDDAEIVAVASPADDLESFAAERASDAATYSSLDEAVTDEEVDVVDVCTPTHTHRELVELAAGRGYDVMCEKPIASSLEDARAIADAVEAADVTFMVGHAVRFSAAYNRIKKVIEDGEIGDPGVVRARRAGPAPDWGWNDWFADLEKSGGVLLDLVIHDFDYLRWTLGDVEEVFVRSRRWHEGDRLKDHAVAYLEFEDGTVAHVEGSWAQPDTREFGYSIEIAGDNGLVEFDGTGPQPYEVYAANEPRADDPDGDKTMQYELEHFLDCRETGEPPIVSVEDAIEAARISFAALESAERGEPVRIEEVVS